MREVVSSIFHIILCETIECITYFYHTIENTVINAMAFNGKFGCNTMTIAFVATAFLYLTQAFILLRA